MKREAYSRILGVLRGRYPRTMLEGWSNERFKPFHHLIGTILSARCRDETTDAVCRKLFPLYPDAPTLAGARSRDIEPLIRKIGFFRQKARYIIETSQLLIERHGGNVPKTLEELTALPGVGRKVANCVLVYAFGKPAIAVDTHVHRVSNRMGWVKTKSPDQTERELVRILPKKHWLIINELLVAHGKATCKPITPKCEACRVAKWCRKVGVKR